MEGGALDRSESLRPSASCQLFYASPATRTLLLVLIRMLQAARALAAQALHEIGQCLPSELAIGERHELRDALDSLISVGLLEEVALTFSGSPYS